MQKTIERAQLIMTTNEQWLKSLDTDELAETLARFTGCNFAPCKKYCNKIKLGCDNVIHYWLKQEREE